MIYVVYLNPYKPAEPERRPDKIESSKEMAGRNPCCLQNISMELYVNLLNNVVVVVLISNYTTCQNSTKLIIMFYQVHILLIRELHNDDLR